MECDDRRLPPFPTRRASSLFCYLVLNRERFHSRARLAGTFWAQRQKSTALKRLRTALWRIRTVLEPDDGSCDAAYLLTGSKGVAFDRDAAFWLDVEEFEETIRKAEEARERGAVREHERLLRRGVSFYRGDLLEDLYDEWCLVEQERLRRLLVTSYEQLMDHSVARGEWRRAVAYAQRMLRHDPLREHVHRRLMRLYYRMGDRPAALQQYDRCKKLLGDALEVEPMKRTRALARAIREESEQLEGPVSRLQRRPRRSVDAPRTPGRESPRLLFTDATRDIEEALEKIRRGLDGIPGDTGQGTTPPSTRTGDGGALTDAP